MSALRSNFAVCLRRSAIRSPEKARLSQTKTFTPTAISSAIERSFAVRIPMGDGSPRGRGRRWRNGHELLTAHLGALGVGQGSTHGGLLLCGMGWSTCRLLRWDCYDCTSGLRLTDGSLVGRDTVRTSRESRSPPVPCVALQ